MENGTEYLKAGVEPLLQWYETHRRPLPFRDAPTPYRVWISEIMLQQTRIEAVLPRYEAFLRALPTVQALAEVSEAALLKLWEGLGYYSRARHLRQAAQQMMQQYGGELPADFAALRALPGIGDYTAGAIASIAYGIAVPAVDGNVLRVLARLLCYREDVLQGKPRAYLSRVAAALVPEDRPGMFNEAVMELGETVCLPNGEPKCDVCPLGGLCAARREGCAAQLPVRIPKTKRRTERRTVFVVVSDERPARVLLHRRPETGLLAGLWELPNFEGEEAEAALQRECPLQVLDRAPLPAARHLFSHITWEMTGIRLTVPPTAALPDGYLWAGAEALTEQYALPSAFRAYAGSLPDQLRGAAAT